MTAKKGDRFRALADVEVHGVVTFGAPFSSGFDGVFPKGAICVVDMDPPAGARGVYLVPEEYERFERIFVSEHDRGAEEYSSYALAIDFDQLAQSFERVVKAG